MSQGVEMRISLRHRKKIQRQNFAGDCGPLKQLPFCVKNLLVRRTKLDHSRRKRHKKSSIRVLLNF
jgi:hypothetical protein